MGECGDQEQVPGWYVVEEEPRTHSRYCIAAKQHNIGEGVEGFTLFHAWFNILEADKSPERFTTNTGPTNYHKPWMYNYVYTLLMAYFGEIQLLD